MFLIRTKSIIKVELLKACFMSGLPLLLASWLTATATAQTWVEQYPAGTLSTPRDSTLYAYDELNDRLILFAGENGPGMVHQHNSEVWVLLDATGAGGSPAWQELDPDGTLPPGRISGSAVYDPTSNRLTIHGGCGRPNSPHHCSPGFRDAWVLTNANGLGGTPAWIRLPDWALSGTLGKGGHTALYDPGSNRMIVFGGHRLFFFTDVNDVVLLQDANGLGSPLWVNLAPGGSAPAPRSFHVAVYDDTANRMIIFGGQQTGVEIPFNDVWVLTHANGMGGPSQWIQLLPTGTLPPARSHSTAVYDAATNRMTVFGGVDFTGSGEILYNDVWVLEGANGAGGPPVWTLLAPTGGPPLERIAHAAGYSGASNRMVAATGTARPPRLDDVWVLTGANGILDADGDGVTDDLDVCSSTTIPESVPSRRLGPNRFALVDGDGVFDTTLPPGGGGGPGMSFTIDDTGGCSCEQIIEALALGNGHIKFGCSISAMEAWTALVNP